MKEFRKDRNGVVWMLSEESSGILSRAAYEALRRTWKGWRMPLYEDLPLFEELAQDVVGVK